MRLESLRLHDFRNYADVNVSFTDGIHILTGKNAQGKTNLLESILYLSTTRSHRTSEDKDLIKEGEQAFFIKALIAKEQKTEEIRVTVNEKGKNLFIYQNPVNRVSDFIGEFNSVMFCPDDMNLFQASPRVRRRFVDMELSKISKKYVSTLYVATRLLKERNAYLKQEQVDRSYLEVLTSQLVDASVVIMKQRHFFLEELLDKCRTFYRQLSNDDTDITVRYLSCVPFSDSEEALKEALLKKYQKHQDRDLLLKQTTAGIHKEDFIFEMNGHELVSFASQGQKRSVLLALKIGMIHMIHEIIQEYPVLLLDDVFSELDSYRKQELLKSLPKEVQIFISTTDFVEMVDMKSDRRVTLWNVSNGTIERC